MEQNKNILFNIFSIAIYVKFWTNSIQIINAAAFIGAWLKGWSSVQDWIGIYIDDSSNHQLHFHIWFLVKFFFFSFPMLKFGHYSTRKPLQNLWLMWAKNRVTVMLSMIGKLFVISNFIWSIISINTYFNNNNKKNFL